MFNYWVLVGRSLPAKCMSLKNRPCIVRPTCIDLNSVELTNYQFMSWVDKCDESYVLMTYL